MKKHILTITIIIAAALAIAASDAKTIQDRVEEAALDTSKIAELMPEKPEEQEQFRAELLHALDKMPASPKERDRKIVAAKKAFADFQEKERGSKVILCPVAAPETFTGAAALELTSSQTNSVAATNIIWALEEIDMGYGLDRKPRTMDKSKKYYPGWRRGEEPGGYPCQTVY